MTTVVKRMQMKGWKTYYRDVWKIAAKHQIHSFARQQRQPGCYFSTSSLLRKVVESMITGTLYMEVVDGKKQVRKKQL